MLSAMSRTSTSSPEVFRAHCAAILKEEAALREGGGKAGQERQRKWDRLPVRERIALLLDKIRRFSRSVSGPRTECTPEPGVFRRPESWSGSDVQGVPCMIVANDATVKAGAFFPQTTKKFSGRNGSRSSATCRSFISSIRPASFCRCRTRFFPTKTTSAASSAITPSSRPPGVPQFAAIMGNCVAGGAYLPVLCDKILMTEGSGLYLAGPALVKAAIGQIVDAGGTRRREDARRDQRHRRFPRAGRRVVPETIALADRTAAGADDGETATVKSAKPAKQSRCGLRSGQSRRPKQYDVRDLLASIVDGDSLDEYKAEYGKTLVCAYARIGGQPVGIVASQRAAGPHERSEGMQIGGVIYSDSADKAARFIMDCNQTGLPIVFFQDVIGFMVGRDAEQSGIIRSGANW